MLFRSAESGGQHLSYGELDQRAEHLAAQLRKHNLQAGSLVATYFDRSLEMVVGLMGIWKAGGAYMPIDPEYPAERPRSARNDYLRRDVVPTNRYAQALSRRTRPVRSLRSPDEEDC